ncbi:hypothetical protein MGG_15659 [Pyricularia oryzae 70-15]|uniref:Uncharacterized protein n=1 Tax=Pyricularia oryzae (strain 70-15 / ATCC MYA-4617 / FGSC 8958) TaxID=242507 RepID=G4MY54_PYRO7|nr:uncharacterized protein MGG_15659 [Pyricularia oryzae 70-15]EHA54385.1 hypothetical protein MGG_15659 [Pyricularia oryzae 70-15]
MNELASAVRLHIGINLQAINAYKQLRLVILGADTSCSFSEQGFKICKDRDLLPTQELVPPSPSTS